MEVKHGILRRENEKEIESNVIIEMERNGKERKLSPAKDGETTPLPHPSSTRQKEKVKFIRQFCDDFVTCFIRHL